MRRKEREIQNKVEIFDVLNRCDTVRIGMQGNQYPYVVPVSFGMEVVNDKAVIYFHCAQQGFGKCQLITDIDEMKHGLKVLTDHYEYHEYPIDRCMEINHLLIGKIVLDKITGKRNLPGAMTPADQALQN